MPSPDNPFPMDDTPSRVGRDFLQKLKSMDGPGMYHELEQGAPFKLVQDVDVKTGKLKEPLFISKKEIKRHPTPKFGELLEQLPEAYLNQLLDKLEIFDGSKLKSEFVEKKFKAFNGTEASPEEYFMEIATAVYEFKPEALTDRSLFNSKLFTDRIKPSVKPYASGEPAAAIRFLEYLNNIKLAFPKQFADLDQSLNQEAWADAVEYLKQCFNSQNMEEFLEIYYKLCCLNLGEITARLPLTQDIWREVLDFINSQQDAFSKTKYKVIAQALAPEDYKTSPITLKEWDEVRKKLNQMLKIDLTTKKKDNPSDKSSATLLYIKRANWLKYSKLI